MATEIRLEEFNSHHLLKHLFPLLRERTDFSPILIDILEVIVMDLTKLQSEVQTLKDAGHAAADELSALAAKVVSLQQAGADNITQADIDSIADSVSGVTSALSTATEGAATTSTPAPGAPDPSGGGTAPGTPDPGTVTTSSPTGPGVTVSDPTVAPTGGPVPAPEPSASDRPVYTFDGDQASVSANVWPSTGLETAEDTPRLLFFFVSDTQNADGSWTANGVGAGWTQYTGATQPAGTGSTGTDTVAQVGSAPATGTAPAPGAETGTSAPGAPTPRSSEGVDQEIVPEPAPGEAVENTASEPGQPPQVEQEGWGSEPGPDQVSPGG